MNGRLEHRTKLAGPALIALAWMVAACGGSSSGEGPAAPDTGPADSEDESSAPKQADAADEDEEAAPEEKGIPTKCAKPGEEVCTPPKGFVNRLCKGFYPDVALVLFASSPFTRGYLAANVRAWNASGGASSDDELKFDEEVIIVRYRKADPNGIQVSGAGGSYDVLRWDGTCATLADEELTLKEPPTPLNANVTWNDLSDEIQLAMLDDDELREVNKARKQECRGVSMGAVSQKCVQLVDKQSKLIVEYVRGGGALPTPSDLP